MAAKMTSQIPSNAITHNINLFVYMGCIMLMGYINEGDVILNKKRRGISRSSVVDKKQAHFCSEILLQCNIISVRIHFFA